MSAICPECDSPIDVDEYDVHAVLARRFEHATVEARRLAEHSAQGYSGIVLAWAR